MDWPRLEIFYHCWKAGFYSKTQTVYTRIIQMTGIELLIVIGGCYAIYTVGMAIATSIDYYSTSKDELLVMRARQYQNKKR